MFKRLKLVASLAITATLVACGGGGGDSAISGSSGVSVKNPLKKYEGTWYVCDEHQKITYSISTTETSGLNLDYSEEFYSDLNCSGQLWASYKWNAPQQITHKDTTSATLPSFTIFPFSGTVDSVTIVTPASTATLKQYFLGDDCLSFVTSSTRYRIDPPGVPTTGWSLKCWDQFRGSSTSSGALYLTADNQYLVQLKLENGVLTTDQILSRSSTFKLRTLVWGYQNISIGRQ